MNAGIAQLLYDCFFRLTKSQKSTQGIAQRDTVGVEEKFELFITHTK